MLLSYFRVNLEEHYFFYCSLYLHHGKSQENGKRLRDSWWKWGVTWLRRGVKFFPAKNEQTSVKTSAKLHTETLVELLARLGISQWIFFHHCHRGISLSTFQMKCTHFQCSPLCKVLWDTFPTSCHGHEDAELLDTSVFGLSQRNCSFEAPLFGAGNLQSTAALSPHQGSTDILQPSSLKLLGSYQL